MLAKTLREHLPNARSAFEMPKLANLNGEIDQGRDDCEASGLP
jgi:hypothetical protein